MIRLFLCLFSWECTITLNFVFQVWTYYRRTADFGGLKILKGRLLFYYSLRGWHDHRLVVRGFFYSFFPLSLPFTNGFCWVVVYYGRMRTVWIHNGFCWAVVYYSRKSSIRVHNGFCWTIVIYGRMRSIRIHNSFCWAIVKYGRMRSVWIHNGFSPAIVK